MSEPLVLAIDQGTSSTKALLVDRAGSILARGSAPLEQQAPRAGWVEHRADDVMRSVVDAVADVRARGADGPIACIGLANQRESLLVWDRRTGAAVSPLISWQDRRTIDRCAELTAQGHAPLVQQVSGLPLDPMFSAVKAAWLLDTYDPDRSHADALCLGTVDSWILWHLTGEHVIEAGNASRTSLVDLATGQWSPDLLEIFGIPAGVLPTIVDSVGPIGRGVRGLAGLEGVPVTGVLGDSHAALFAHAGWRPGLVKATYGTGSSVMGLADSRGSADSADSAAGNGLCRTIAWRLPGQRPAIAWEANILSAGSTLTWLAGVLGLDVAALVAEASPTSGEVSVVPAFNGLGAPWWDPSAQAVITGMSLASTRGDLARGALDSVICQVADVVAAMTAAGVQPASLVADGGMTANTDLMQRQADLCGVRVEVSATAELSALGAADAAALGAGLVSQDDLQSRPRGYVTLDPAPHSAPAAEQLRATWARALQISRTASTRA